MVDSDTEGWRPDFHEIRPPAHLNRYPPVDLAVSCYSVQEGESPGFGLSEQTVP